MVLRTPRRVSRLVLVLALAVPGVVLEQPAPVEAAVPVWQKYAPLVRFHPQERYWPAHATGFFIRFSELRYSVTRSFSWRIRGVGQIDPYRLGTKRWREAYAWLGCTGSTWFRTYDRTRPYDSRRNPCLAPAEGFYLDLRDTRRTGEGARLSQVPVYYLYWPGRYVVYWFFYAYNDASSNLADHEGDWERIVVDLSSQNRAVAVAYYTHGCAPRIYRWGTVPKVRSNGMRDDRSGTHPIVYAALGSHGSWREVGDGSRDTCMSRLGIGEDKVSRGGRQWRTWNRGSNVAAQPWWGFGGAWGHRGRWTHTTGPMGPESRRVPAGW